MLNAKELDAALLFSPSAAEALFELTKKMEKPPVVAIGPITGKRANELGFELLAEADEHTVVGLLNKLCELYKT